MFRVHRWVGLHCCLVLGLIFGSGTLLLFSPELSNLGRPDLWTSLDRANAQEATPGQIYDAILAEQQGGRIAIIASGSRPWFGRPVYGVGPNGGFTAHVHTQTADIIGYGGKSLFRDVVRKTHDSLLVPFSKASLAVNALSFVVLMLVVTGLITYRRFWKGYFRRPHTTDDSRVRRGAWHRLTGIWIAPFLIASTLGSSVFFANDLGWKVSIPNPQNLPEPRDASVPVGFDGVELDKLISSCKKQLPTFKDAVVYMPEKTVSAVVIHGYDTDVGSIFGNARCFADPYTGAVLSFVKASDGNVMAILSPLAVAVHYGTWAGWTSLVLWLIGGVGSLFLALTGAQIYASRIQRERAASGLITPTGTLPLLIKGLGVFKWGYLILILGMCAMVAKRAFF